MLKKSFAVFLVKYFWVIIVVILLVIKSTSATDTDRVKISKLKVNEKEIRVVKVPKGKYSVRISPEKAIEKAKKTISKLKKIEFDDALALFVNCRNPQYDNFYLICVLRQGNLVGYVNVDAYGMDVPKSGESIWTEKEPKPFDSTYFSLKQVSKRFEEAQKVKGWQSILVFSGDIDVLDIPQPCWYIVDEQGKDWYMTLSGKIYDAQKLRKDFIEELKKFKVE